MKKLLIFVFVMLFSFSLLFAGESYLSIPLDSDAYRIIDAAEIRGIIPNQTDVKPYSISRVKSLLNVIYSSNLTTDSERKAIEKLLSQFDSTYGVSSEKSFLEKGYLVLSENENALVSFGGKIKTEQTVGVTNKAFDSRNKLTFYAKGDLFNSLSFYMDFGILLDKLDHRAFLVTDFTHECDGFYMSLLGSNDLYNSPFKSLGDGFVMYPELATSLFSDNLIIRFASLSRDWGPGINNLALSSSARSFDAVEFTLQPSSWFSLSAAVGSLGKSYLVLDGEADKTGDKELHSNVYDNNFSIQRIEIEPFEGFRASIFESVVWRKRFELAYLNPLGVYMFAQNYIGDFDNMLAGLDATYTIKGVGKAYFSLAIDEFNSLNKFKVISFARNIIALQGGATINIPYGDFSTLGVQATYIPPFFGSHYTYTSDKNPWGSTPMGTAYVNKGYNLSYPLYPDSLELLAQFSTTITQWDLSLSFIVKDQMRSAQYSTDDKGTSLNNIINYKVSELYVDKDFFSYIWNNTLDIEVKGKKSFDNLPFDFTFGLQCLIESKRTYSFDPNVVKHYDTYDIVDGGNTMIFNPGNGTRMNSDWSTNCKLNLSIGFSLYY